MGDDLAAMLEAAVADQEAGRLAEADAAYARLMAARPTHPDLLYLRGTVAFQQGRPAAAVDWVRGALAVRPDFAAHQHNLGVALRAARRIPEAFEAHRRAVILDPRHVPALMAIGRIAREIGELNAARAAYEAALAVEPEHAEARHLLAASGGAAAPERAADAYVTQHFDAFAAGFETKLARLAYRGPALIGELVGRWAAGRPGLAVLDAGCGTGLCAPALRRFAVRLVGVDLSEGMVDRARETKLYDTLERAELTAFLAAVSDRFDLIVAADTLCYFGRLEPALAAMAAALRPGGAVIFTVERALDEPEAGWRLAPHGRYVHGAAYVERAIASGRLVLRELQSVVLREEASEPVPALLALAEKPRQEESAAQNAGSPAA